MVLLPIISLRTTPATVHFSHHDVIGGWSDPTKQEIARTTEKSSTITSRFIKAEAKILKSILRPSRYKKYVQNSKKAPSSFDLQAISPCDTTVSLQDQRNRQDDFKSRETRRNSSNKQQTRKKEEFSSFFNLRHKKQHDNCLEDVLNNSLTNSVSTSNQKNMTLSLHTSSVKNLHRKTLKKSKRSDYYQSIKTNMLPDITTKLKGLHSYSCAKQKADFYIQGGTTSGKMIDDLEKAFQAFKTRMTKQHQPCCQNTTVSSVASSTGVKTLLPFIGSPLSLSTNVITPTGATAGIVTPEAPVISSASISFESLPKTFSSLNAPSTNTLVPSLQVFAVRPIKLPITTSPMSQAQASAEASVKLPRIDVTKRSKNNAPLLMRGPSTPQHVLSNTYAPVMLSTSAVVVPPSDSPALSYHVNPPVPAPTVPFKNTSVQSAEKGISSCIVPDNCVPVKKLTSALASAPTGGQHATVKDQYSPSKHAAFSSPTDASRMLLVAASRPHAPQTDALFINLISATMMATFPDTTKRNAWRCFPQLQPEPIPHHIHPCNMHDSQCLLELLTPVSNIKIHGGLSIIASSLSTNNHDESPATFNNDLIAKSVQDISVLSVTPYPPIAHQAFHYNSVSMAAPSFILVGTLSFKNSTSVCPTITANSRSSPAHVSIQDSQEKRQRFSRSNSAIKSVLQKITLDKFPEPKARPGSMQHDANQHELGSTKIIGPSRLSHQCGIHSIHTNSQILLAVLAVKQPMFLQVPASRLFHCYAFAVPYPTPVLPFPPKPGGGSALFVTPSHEPFNVGASANRADG